MAGIASNSLGGYATANAFLRVMYGREMAVRFLAHLWQKRLLINRSLSHEKYHTRFGYGIFGGESEIRTRATVCHSTNPLAGGPLIASWVFLRGYGNYSNTR